LDGGHELRLVPRHAGEEGAAHLHIHGSPEAAGLGNVKQYLEGEFQLRKDTSANLRYKSGSNIGGDPRQVMWIQNPAEYQLPEEYKGMHYVIAKEDFYLTYPTKAEEYRRRYEGTFQHGGVSMEEMILPVVTMRGK